MKHTIDSLDYLKVIIIKELSRLDETPKEYLNEAGKAAREAYAAVLWHLYFHDDIKSLRESKEFKELLEIQGKDKEYYRILRVVFDALDRKEE